MAKLCTALCTTNAKSGLLNRVACLWESICDPLRNVVGLVFHELAESRCNVRLCDVNVVPSSDGGRTVAHRAGRGRNDPCPYCAPASRRCDASSRTRRPPTWLPRLPPRVDAGARRRVPNCQCPETRTWKLFRASPPPLACDAPKTSAARGVSGKAALCACRLALANVDHSMRALKARPSGLTSAHFSVE